jgi:PAS domain S-box-containing protein
MSNPIHVLILEDYEADAELMVHELRQAGFDPDWQRVEDEPGYLAALQTTTDLILADWVLPHFSGSRALQIMKEKGLDIPFIIVSGVMGEDTAVEAMRVGAADYLFKDRLARLGEAARRALKEKILREERYGIEEKLRESENRYHLVFENSGTANTIFDTDCRVILQNSMSQKLTEPMNAVGKTALEIFGPEQGPMVTVRMQRVLTSGVAEVFDNEFINFSKIRWMHSSYQPLLDNQHGVVGIQVISQDVTIRKQAEDELRESKRLLERTLSSLLDAVFIIDADTLKILDCNPAASTIFGYSRQEILNRTTTFLHINQRSLEKFRQHLNSGVEEKGFLFMPEFKMKRKDGTVFPSEHSVIPIENEQGKRIGWVSVVRDITETKQAENALRESEDKFRYVFDHSSAGKSFTQISGELNVNRAFSEMVGYSVEELNHRKWQEITVPEDVELTLNANKALISGRKESMRFTKKFIHKNGTIVWADVAMTLRRDNDKKPLYFMTTFLDITERKRAEEKLKESEERFRSLYENATIGMYRTSPDGRIVMANPALVSMLGYDSFEEVSQRDLASEGYEPGYPRMEFQKRIEQEGEVRGLEAAWNRKGGSVVFVRESAHLVRDENNQPLYYEGTVEDISKRKRAEEALRASEAELRALFASMHDVVMVIDREGVYRKFAPTNPELLVRPAEELIGKPLKNVFPKKQADVFVDVLQKVVETKQTTQIEYDLPIGDRTVKFETTISPLTEDSTLWVAHDITARKHAEEQIIQLNTELEQRVEERTRELRLAQEKIVRQEKLAMLGQLAGGVGHELRNPLGIISNAVYYLKLIQPDADEKVRRYHSMIAREVQTSEKIITDLMDFARLESMERSQVSVAELVQWTLMRFTVPESIKTTLKLPENLPDVLVDMGQIQQVLGNIVDNACQAIIPPGIPNAKPRGGRITISARKIKGMVAISVKDSGEGITPENMARVFEPLFTTKAKGIGLGLAVSKKLAEANGGRIEVKSELGKGSTFTLCLPVGEVKP